jgi:hypothetical protein
MGERHRMPRVLGVMALGALALAGCSQSPTVAAAPPAAPAPVAAVRTVSADQVAGRLKAAGVPLRVSVVYTAATDPNHQLGRPGGYTSKLAFTDSRIRKSEVLDVDPQSLDRGGSIEVFADPADAQARSADIQQKIKSLGGLLTREYHYLNGGVLVRVSGLLTPDQAKTYQKALASLPG